MLTFDEVIIRDDKKEETGRVTITLIIKVHANPPAPVPVTAPAKSVAESKPAVVPINTDPNAPKVTRADRVEVFVSRIECKGLKDVETGILGMKKKEDVNDVFLKLQLGNGKELTTAVRDDAGATALFNYDTTGQDRADKDKMKWDMSVDDLLQKDGLKLAFSTWDHNNLKSHTKIGGADVVGQLKAIRDGGTVVEEVLTFDEVIIRDDKKEETGRVTITLTIKVHPKPPAPAPVLVTAKPAVAPINLDGDGKVTRTDRVEVFVRRIECKGLKDVEGGFLGMKKKEDVNDIFLKLQLGNGKELATAVRDDAGATALFNYDTTGQDRVDKDKMKWDMSVEDLMQKDGLKLVFSTWDHNNLKSHTKIGGAEVLGQLKAIREGGTVVEEVLTFDEVIIRDDKKEETGKVTIVLCVKVTLVPRITLPKTFAEKQALVASLDPSLRNECVEVFVSKLEASALIDVEAGFLGMSMMKTSGDKNDVYMKLAYGSPDGKEGSNIWEATTPVKSPLIRNTPS